VEYQVRAARITDVDRLVALSHEAVFVADRGDTRIAPDLLRQLVYLPQASIFVAERGRELAGGAVLALRPSVRAGGYVGTVDLFMVDPQHDIDLVTEALIEELLRSARNKGCGTVEAAHAQGPGPLSLLLRRMMFSSPPLLDRYLDAAKKEGPVSLAQVSYRPLHTFYFENAAGEGRWARYHWEPEAGIAGQPIEELAKQPHDYLYDEFEGRLSSGPVAFRLELELAEAGDTVDDPSVMWPEGRERVVVGRLELNRRITEAEIGDPVMMHDPTAVTDGIEVSLDDQIIAVRRGAYRTSVAERTGGWQAHAKFQKSQGQS